METERVPSGRRPEEWPAYHLTARLEEGAAMPFDPNGCLFWKGRYHLMYIYQDPRLPQGGHCWGHLSSGDLLHWTRHPPALVPNPGDADRGTFSGNAFLNRDGVPMLCWFGIDAGVCVATAEDDGLVRWRKHPANPIIPIPKPGERGYGDYVVWDPYLWLEGETYYCLLGGNRLADGKDTLYLCRSADLVHWKPLHPFYTHPDPDWTDSEEDCSCPDFFPLGDRHALLCISHKVGARCYIGRYANERFFPERHVRMNWPGGMCFAPESLVDAGGRRLFWAWVTDPRIGPSQRAAGSGAQSLPRVLSLAPDGTLRIAPAAEMEGLRRRHRSARDIALPADSEALLPDMRGDCLELSVEIEPGQAREVGLLVRCSPDGAEATAIRYAPAAKTLRIEMSRSTLRTDVTYCQPPFHAFALERASDNERPIAAVEAPLELPPGERLRLRVFLDRPLLEVFANERQCLTQQIYPSRQDSLLVKAYARGGAATVRSAESWEMAPLVFSMR
jgi:sucrose-6-phosphate hydrolase SacC (GH32 family)